MSHKKNIIEHRKIRKHIVISDRPIGKVKPKGQKGKDTHLLVHPLLLVVRFSYPLIGVNGGPSAKADVHEL